MAAQHELSPSQSTRTLYVTAGHQHWQLLVPQQSLVLPASLRDEMGRQVHLSSIAPADFDPDCPKLVDLSLSGAMDHSSALLGMVDDGNAPQWVQCCKPIATMLPAHAPKDDRRRVEGAVSQFTQRRIEARLHETLCLPALPRTAQDILTLSQNRNYDLADLVAVIEQDPALAARLVGWANSAYFAAPGSVTSIGDAIVRVIGFDGTINMALSIAFDQAIPTAPAPLPGLPAYWVEALLTAALMEHLAARAPQSALDPGTAYLIGLLSGFGTLVLAHVFPPQFEQIRQLQTANSHVLYAYCDETVLGVTREVVGAALLESWGLPVQVCAAVRNQHDADQLEPLTALLRFSRALLAAEGLSSCPRPATQPSPDAGLSLRPEVVASALRLVQEPQNELVALANLFGGTA